MAPLSPEDNINDSGTSGRPPLHPGTPLYADPSISSSSSWSPSSTRSFTSNKLPMFPVTERRVSFYPMVQVHDSDDDVLEDESQEFWYSPKELQTMERYAQDTARRMSLHYKLRRNDCKRGIENLTSQGLLATRTVRMNALVAVLAEQSQHSSREYIAEVYGRIVQSASIRAYDQASVDAYEAAQVHGRRNEQQYDKEEEDDDNDNVNCWFWKTTAQWLRTISQSRQNRIAPSPGL